MFRRPSRWQDRWFPWATMLIAMFWVYNAWHWGPQIREANRFRIGMSMFVGGMGLSEPTPESHDASTPNLLSSFSLLTSGPKPLPNSSQQNKRPLQGLKAGQIVETVLYVWEWIMYGIASLIILAAVASWLTDLTRCAHLCAAAVMLLGTITTLICLQIIESPSAGAMPPLPLFHHVLAGAALSAYAWVLLIVFARKPGQLAEAAVPAFAST